MKTLSIFVDNRIPFHRDMAKEQQWKLEARQTAPSGTLKVVPSPVLLPQEAKIEFQTFQSRMPARPLGQRHAEAILKKDPLCWEWGSIRLIFPATRWVSGIGLCMQVLRLLVPHKRELGLEMDWRWVGFGFEARDHVLHYTWQPPSET